jgi:hypothetical protein
MSQIAIFVGSLRKDSINRKLARAVTQLAPSQLSFTWPRIDDLPLYNQDDDASPHPHVVRLKREIASAHSVPPLARRAQPDGPLRQVARASCTGCPIALSLEGIQRHE